MTAQGSSSEHTHLSITLNLFKDACITCKCHFPVSQTKTDVTCQPIAHSQPLIYTVIILNIGTDRSEQTVKTQIRLLLMEQSDQGLLCLLFCLHLLNTILH